MPHPPSPLQLWLLRILVRCPRKDSWLLPPPSPVLRALGMADASNVSPRKLAKQLGSRLAALEATGIDRCAVILRNVKTLGRMFGLDAVERDLA